MSRLKGIHGLFVSTAALTLMSVSACSDDDAHGGAAGSAGSRGGTAGTAGTTAGTAGTTAGSGGSSGSSGTGGTPDAGGTPGSGGTDGGSDADSGGSGGTLVTTLSPLPAVPPDTTNRVADNAAVAALGQKLFFDQLFSGPLKVASDLGAIGQSGKVSCASCHSSPYLDDERSMPETVSIGADVHSRNSPTLVNASFYKWTNWGGRFAAQWELPLVVAESPLIMNSNRLKIAHRIFDVYKAEYEAIPTFGALEPALSETTRFPADGKPKPAPTTAVPNPADGLWETAMTDPDRLIVNTILVNYSKAIAAYMRLLVSRNAPFDAWVAGNATAIDAPAVRGAQLFVGKARCITCHSGPHFSDDKFHNLGVPQMGPNVPASDDGRFKDVPGLLSSPFNVEGAFSDDTNTDRLTGLTNPMPDDTKSAFRTPDLRGVALTAPYMHSGQLSTLEAVIEFYVAGGGTPVSGKKDSQMFPLLLTQQEQADLVSFLKSLTGAPVPPALLVDSTP